MRNVIPAYLLTFLFLCFNMLTRIIIIFSIDNNYLFLLILYLLIDINIAIYPNCHHPHLYFFRSPLQLECFTFIVNCSPINLPVTYLITLDTYKVSRCNLFLVVISNVICDVHYLIGIHTKFKHL